MSDNDKQSIGKIEPKRIMAYPLNEDVPFQYELRVCSHCNEEYLSQCDIVMEEIFCPRHATYDFCFSCEKSFDKSVLKIDETDNELYCKSCYCPKCTECGECVNESDLHSNNNTKNRVGGARTNGTLFCSQSCYTNYFSDLEEQ